MNIIDISKEKFQVYLTNKTLILIGRNETKFTKCGFCDFQY